MSPYEAATIGIGIALGMFYYARTGWGCGGIITPGFLALSLNAPSTLLLSLGVAAAVALLLRGAVRVLGVFGRQRMALALLLALLLRLGLSLHWAADSLWLGWVIPGLIAADLERQGPVHTIAAASATAGATAMITAVGGWLLWP
ncbi:MAG: poly-gamma-glutamate biosynthesis protein PgsC/CapC [Synergistales bacterium]|nr:poly-gamma-glutamate biosynthesis protein PgsC/CapC [Synergistales bacterium]